MIVGVSVISFKKFSKLSTIIEGSAESMERQKWLIMLANAMANARVVWF